MTDNIQPRDLLSEGHGYSKVKGFRLQDFDIECPFVEGRLCPEKIEITSEYTAHIKKRSDGLADEAMQDREECIKQLHKFDLTVKKAGCEDAVPTYCPPHESLRHDTSMGYSSIALLAARRVFAIVGLIKH